MSRPTRRSGRLTSDSEMSDAESAIVPGSATRRTSRRVSTSSDAASSSQQSMNYNNVTTRRTTTTTRTVTAATPTKQLAFDLDVDPSLHRIDEIEDDVDDLELSQQIEGTPFRSSASIYTLKTPATVDEHAVPYPQTPGQALGAADAIVYHTDACDSHHQDDHSNCSHPSHHTTLHQFVSKAGGALNAIKRRFSMSGSSRENSEDTASNGHSHSHGGHGHSHNHNHSAAEEDEYTLQTHSHGRAGQRRRKQANGFSSVDEVNDTADGDFNTTELSDEDAEPLITEDGSISPPRRRKRKDLKPHSKSFLRRIRPRLLIPALLALLLPLIGRSLPDTLKHIPPTLSAAPARVHNLYSDTQHYVTDAYHHYKLPELNIKQRASDYLHNSLDRLHWTRSQFHSTPELWSHAVDWVKQHSPSLPHMPELPHLPEFKSSGQIPNLADYFRGSGSHDWHQSKGADSSPGIDWKDITSHVRDSIANAIHTADDKQSKAFKQLSDKLSKELHGGSEKHVKQVIDDAMKNARSELQSAISKSSSMDKSERDALAKQVMDHVQQQLQSEQKQWKDSVLDTVKSQMSTSLKSSSSDWKDEVLSTIRKELDSKPDAAIPQDALKSLRDEFSSAIGKHGSGNAEALKHLKQSLSDATSKWESSSSDLLNKVLAAVRDEFSTKADHGELENKLTSLISKELHSVEQRLQQQIKDLSNTKSKQSAIKDVGDVQSLIDRALERYAADWTEEVDYALKSSGGLILAHSSTHRPYVPETNTVATKLLSYIRTPIPPTYYGKPDQLITASNGVGECWPMNSTNGWIMIKLREPIHPTKITYQHVSSHIIPDNSTTPQRFVVYGVSDRQVRQAQMTHTNENPIGDKLAEFTYINTGRQLQQFTLQPPADRAYQVITVAVLDNYGNPTYTCLYRVRVHGQSVAPTKSTGQLPLYNMHGRQPTPLNLNQRP